MLPKRLSTNFAPTPIGARNTKINILKLGANRGPAGEPTWDTFAANIWAKMEIVRHLYKEKQQQVVSEATHRVIIDYMDGVTTAMRIQVNGAIYQIDGQPSDPDGSRRELWIHVFVRNDGATGVQA